MRAGGAGVALLLALGLGCVTPTPPASSATDALARALAALPHAPDAAHCARLAEAALDETARLHAQYRPLRPALAGNAAFHLGLRERALCCHWAEDLLRALTTRELDGFALHWGVAHLGNPLREHSAIVAVPEGGRFEDGLVLDPWRRSGHLVWARVGRDRYPWTLHPSDPQRDRLRCSDGGA